MPNNVFKQNLADTPREVLNWRLFLAVVTFGLMGAARGLDEGLISGTINQKAFLSEYPVKYGLTAGESAQRIGNITSMVQIGSVGGALLAFILSDRIGRVWATRQLCVVWIVGIIIYITSDGRLGQLYAGRFIAGLGIGQTTVVAPTYLAEVSPRSIRGLCICAFSGCVYLGIMLGYFANYGTELHLSSTSSNQWIVPTSMHIMFAGIILILTLGVHESPRFLAKVNKPELAARTLAKIRNLPEDHPYVLTEFLDIQDQLQREKEATNGTGFLNTLKELFATRANLYRFMLGLWAQLLSQWSGGNAITIYAPEFFSLLGRSGDSEKLFVTAILGVVKLVAALSCALFLIDFIGRKRSLYIGITLQFISMLYIAILLTAVPGVQKGTHQSNSAQHAVLGGVVMVYISGVGWAMGWNSIQYLINAEIFPLRVRAIGTSIVMCLHFVNQYGNSKALPLMLIHLTAQGTFFFFAAVTLIGLGWAWFFLPEMAGLSLEATDEIFALPWYQIGRRGAKVGKEYGGRAEQYDHGDHDYHNGAKEWSGDDKDSEGYQEKHLENSSSAVRN